MTRWRHERSTKASLRETETYCTRRARTATPRAAYHRAMKSRTSIMQVRSCPVGATIPFAVLRFRRSEIVPLPSNECSYTRISRHENDENETSRPFDERACKTLCGRDRRAQISPRPNETGLCGDHPALDGSPRSRPTEPKQPLQPGAAEARCASEVSVAEAEQRARPVTGARSHDWPVARAMRERGR